VNVTIPFEATKTYTAYISQDYPTTGPPTNVYRTAGAVVVTTLSDAELTNVLLNGTDAQLAALLAPVATPEAIAALRAGALRLLTDEGACLEIGAADPTHPAGSSASTTQLACGTGASAVVAVFFGALGVGGAIALLVDYGTSHPTAQPEPEPQPQPDPIVPGGPNDPPVTQVDACQLPPGPDAEVFYFYQRIAQADDILASGLRAVGPQGKIWLASVLYASASEAIGPLALPDPPDGYFEIPRDRLEDLYGPSCVDPYFGQPGGGIEYWTTQPIDMGGLAWHPFP
jgi:hypothetical protein